MKISAVILAGGSGTRLWPLSSKKKPKQFLALFSAKSMIAETSERMESIIPMEQQYVLTGAAYRKLVEEQLNEKVQVLCEPIAKNTAPCLLWAALLTKKLSGGDTIMAVMPSDHVITKEKEFLLALQEAIHGAARGQIVTFGVVPTRPETGYGYIEIENNDFLTNHTIKRVVKFHEKPDWKKAQDYITTGHYLWNSGMFVFCADTMIEEFRNYSPEVYASFAGRDAEDERQIREAFVSSPSISIDYAVMEHTKRAVCIPVDIGWNDVGGFESLFEESAKDENCNVCKGDAEFHNTRNCYINGKKKIVCIGVDDLIIVEGEDAILIAKKEMANQVGDIAKKLD